MTTNLWFPILLLILLIVMSGLISGSEVAYFSLDNNDNQTLLEDESKSSKRILALKSHPRHLLATILISNNFINIAIVILSSYLVDSLLGSDRLHRIGEFLFARGLSTFWSVDQLATIVNFLITVVGVTCILVLFGEIAPKIYANLNNLKFARVMALPLTITKTVLSPFSAVLVNWSSGLERRLTSSNSYQNSATKEDIDAAIELTVSGEEDTNEDQADMLKGIVKFGDVSAKQIMRSRVDVTALDINVAYDEVIDTIKASGYSRIPVYTEDLDNIIGILYVKDLLGNTDKSRDFEWQSLVRPTVLYIPESKKIDDVLKQFQAQRTHMGIVVDEFGGTEGIVTLEDIMEEVIGDIKDEFDEDNEIQYVEISPGKYIFEGKSMLNDVCRIIGVDTNYFDEVKGESDSLAGLVLEMAGVMPKVEHQIEYNDVKLKIVSVSKRRIEKIAVTLEEN